jgi:ell wall binding domain 2 (CWB2)
MLSRFRPFFAGLLHWLSARRAVAMVAGLLAIAGAGVVGYEIATHEGDDGTASEAAPRVLAREVPDAEATTEDLGFPAFATANTTRVAGADPITDAVAVALAAYPSTGGVPGPAAVSLVDAADWASGIAAAALVAEPIGAPVLVTDGGEMPELTANALDALAPSGSASTDDRQAFRIGAAAVPEGLATLDVDGSDPAEIAARIDRLRARLAGVPEHVVLASSDDPAFAMPAASWAARSGDPVLFVKRKSVPAPTIAALERYQDLPVYVLGPESAVSADAMREVREVAPTAKRIAGSDPVSNAIAFARFADGTFGWNINDPGHGLVLANAARPLDAAAAAPLSATGTWGPLLLSEDPAAVPADLRGYLLDLKPGYEDDPTRAVYNHAWLIGDTSALEVAFQAQVDELIELAPIRSGSGATQLAPPPGTTGPERGGGSGGGQSAGAENR